MDSHQFSLSFSPSKAAAQRRQAADWAAVLTFLEARYQGRSVPPFERNDDTLRALLALVSVNEKADEEREILWAVEKKALAEVEVSVHGEE
jgi:HAUS augmin-like complex subunit 1